MNQNIIIFKKFFIIIILISFFFQVILSKSLDDYLILSMLVFINLLISKYCLNCQRFNKYPISVSTIFFSVLMNSSSALFFKSFELSNLSSNLERPLIVFFILFLSNLIIIFSHWIYEKKNQFNKNFIFNLNYKLGLFNINTRFIFLLGTLSILLQLFIEPFLVKDLETTFQQGLDFRLNILNGFDIYAIFPFILIISYPLFKKKIDIKKMTILVLFLSLVFISISSNRRDIIFFTLYSFFLTLIIVFLLDEIKFNKKKFNYLILSILIFSISYDKIIFFNKVYIYERGFADQRSFQKNFKSFFKTYKDHHKDPQSIDFYISRMDINFYKKNYYNSLLFERINPISFGDKIKNKYYELEKYEKQKIINHSINRIISITPQPIISFFNNDFKKTDYIFLTTASYIQQINDPKFFSRNEVGSFFIELNLFFGLVFFIPLFIFSYLLFFVLDSFYDKEKKLFSPIIIVLFYSNGPSILDFFSGGSVDKNLLFLVRELPQSIILYIISFYLYKKFFLKKL